MGRPPVELLFQPVTCYPAWYARYLPYAQDTPRVTSGCATVNGNVQCDPKQLAAHAAQRLGLPVSLEAYTLARYLASEVGTGTLAEKVCVAQDAINRVRYAAPRLGTVTNLLLNNSATNAANRGYYGPIGNGEYGRWAATSRDPALGDLVIALGVLSGDIDPWFSKGADDQMGARANQQNGHDPVVSVRAHAARHQYWVGPIYGVDPWVTIQYRTMPEIDPASTVGQALIQQGVQAMQRPSPSWAGFPGCATRGTSKRGLVATIALSLGVGVGAAWLLTHRRAFVGV